ncbi:MAG: hypothetical protein L0H70_04595 [Xanthomonadales bacterium]|nr:hypothetical protein [Xanthomonadales bacterium]
MTAVALIAALLAASLLLAALRVPAPYPDALGFALLAVDGGLVVGTAAATLHVLRSGAVARMHHADGIREPLLTLPWLNDPHLPHLLDWQRRAALVSWRRGGSFVVVGGVLAVVPHGAVMPKVVALLLLVLSLVWLAVVMRTCAAVAIDAKRLLGAMPLGAIRMRLAALRYPLVAAICAAVMAVTGSIVAQTGVIALAWFACAIAASAWPLGGVIHATAPGQSR